MDTGNAMVPEWPILAACFDLAKVRAMHPHGSVGTECWTVIWRIVSPKQLKGARLLEGETLEMQNRVPGAYFCTGFQSSDEHLLAALQKVVGKAVVFRELAAPEPFLTGEHCRAEPLIGIGAIDSNGTIKGGGWASLAYERVKAERPKTIPANSVRMVCGSCSKVLAVTRDLLGKTVECPVCQTPQVVQESQQRPRRAAAATAHAGKAPASDSSTSIHAYAQGDADDESGSSIHSGQNGKRGAGLHAGGSTLRLDSSVVRTANHPALQEKSKSAEKLATGAKSIWSRLFSGRLLGPFNERYCCEECRQQALKRAEVKARLHRGPLHCGACNEMVSSERIHFVLANGIIAGSGVEEWIFICSNSQCKEQWATQFRKHWDRCVACGQGLN